jgi:aspartyl-tRNA(Asn)/glutamyl-tRNA(Gln) amidotransferase subunit C
MALMDKNVVKYVARLARLKLTEQEEDRMTRDLGDVLKYMEKLNELGTSNVQPTSSILGITNVLRDDKTVSSGIEDKILENAPERQGRFFKVKRVLEK